jgi:two-component system invasion response regulator UvrY
VSGEQPQMPPNRGALGPGREAEQQGALGPAQEVRRQAARPAPRPGPKPISIVLADDHAMVREGLAALLMRDSEIDVVGQAATGAEAVGLTADLQPAVVVVDDGTEGTVDGIEVTRQLQQRQPDVGVVILSDHDNVYYAVNALQSGAMGFVVKTDSARNLIEAIRRVSRGLSYVSACLSSDVAMHLAMPHRKRDTLDRLSPREFELLRWLARGRPLKECARLMHISESTASTYRQRVIGKLGLSSTAGLIRFALTHGIDG